MNGTAPDPPVKVISLSARKKTQEVPAVARKLTVVPPDAPPAPRKAVTRTLKAAVDMSERDLLVSMRMKVATEIDAGVPAHALGGLINRLRELDKEIRLLDARQAEESDSGDVPVEDGDFDASAV